MLPAEHPVQTAFPSRYIALAIPALVHTLIIIVAAAIIGWHLVFRKAAANKLNKEPVKIA